MKTTRFPADEERIKWYKLFRMVIWVCLLKNKKNKNHSLYGLAILTIHIHLEGIIRNVWKDVCVQRVFIIALSITLKNWKQLTVRSRPGKLMCVHTAVRVPAPAVLSQTIPLWGPLCSAECPAPPLTPTRRQEHPPVLTPWMSPETAKCRQTAKPLPDENPWYIYIFPYTVIKDLYLIVYRLIIQ